MSQENIVDWIEFTRYILGFNSYSELHPDEYIKDTDLLIVAKEYLGAPKGIIESYAKTGKKVSYDAIIIERGMDLLWRD